jgi:predicted esterase
MEREVNYNITNTYSTLNLITENTKNVWLLFHGMGYLSRYFIKYFSHLQPDENYIIAPQASSKYYQGTDFKHVGASWLTKENTLIETKNVLRYIDSVYKTENIDSNYNFIVLGYSQGVSIATRWLASRKITCSHLILHSGGIPVELKAEDFSYLNTTTIVTYVYGNQDPYINEARKTEEQLKATKLFGDRLNIEVFDGAHEVNKNFLTKTATSEK